MKKELVLATNNAGKAREFQDLLAGNFVVHTQKEFNVPEVDENGLSFIENAIIKARNAAKYANMPALADDSGLCVDALQGAPGIYSARYCGKWGHDDLNNEKLLNELKDVPLDERSAYYYIALVYVKSYDDPTPIVVTAKWQGKIGFEYKGTNGFGYDPLFIVDGYDKTAAELPPETKQQISHRAQAFQKFAKILNEEA